ncbi:Dethiobiotin synthetase [Leptolyngbya boryana CZ1]|uniref:Dethiobiotin synthetase n=1 Tax=Leptolyngbya boryana CZ1 TaxID=3060204 RepID=A0AA96X7G3_LEPBY|nr:Dethiobiotin synthetase [Leptolyngbya boryana]WNZ46955.1 Dethiobiotin synthetase [Leptolyngbya boryana CZ1]
MKQSCEFTLKWYSSFRSDRSIVDYETARQLLIDQTNSTASDTFLGRLGQGKPPVPGQVTSILLALRVVFDALKDQTTLDRTLVAALFSISNEARRLFNNGLGKSRDCPPLLNEDLDRIAIAVKSIFSGTWQG